MFKQAGTVLAKKWSMPAAGTDSALWPADLQVRQVPAVAS
jgi:hypothetical protein